MQIDKVILSAEFASGMKFKNTSYLDPQAISEVDLVGNQETM